MTRLRIAASQPRPNDAERLYDQGNRYAAAGEAERAAVLFRSSLALAPGFAEAYNNMGNVLRALDRLEEAVNAYHTALKLGFGHPLVHYNLGSVLKQAERGEEAERSFCRALALRPDYAEAYNNRGNLMRALRRLGESAEDYRRAVRLRPDWDEAHDNLGSILYLIYEEGAEAEAARLASVWREEHPDHPIARHIGAALSGDSSEPRASDDYVRQVFDHFADEFDERLAELSYRAPELLGAALKGTKLRPAGHLVVLDAGCGTGLCAPYLRPYARTLVGLDLSPGMLEKAEARGVYDALAEDDLEAFASRYPGRFDLIAAGDVLCYLGDLSTLFPALRAALKPGGVFVFTVEEEADDASGYRVHPHGRYAHTETYIREMLAAAGFAAPHVAHDTLRQESDQPVVGLVVTVSV